MYSSEEECNSRKIKKEHSHTILFNILNRTDDRRSLRHSCHCEQRRLVSLKNPERTCKAASQVLLKTMCFMSSLPAFHHLLGLDQFLLLRSHWVQLFVLGLAQERVMLDVDEFPMTSFLRKILLQDQNDDTEHGSINVAAVQDLRSCLDQLWRLDLSPEEYAYLKGTILFNPDVPGLINRELIEELQRESQRLLHQAIHKLHPHDHTRLPGLLLTASSLHTVTPHFVTELFFRRVIGQINLLDLLTEMIFNAGRV